MSDIAIEIENLRKQYRLGMIGGTTLNAELQSWWARKRGKEDPNQKLGTVASDGRETFWALDGINLQVKKGEALGIIGGNGAGKSTLLKILSRVTAPTEGTIGINGRISSMLEVGTGFHGEMTGRENIYMNGAILGMSKKEVDAKMEDIIEFSECRQFIDTPVKRYSSGMYVKLAFAVAAHLDSEILVMDEVLAVGDMKFQEKCLGKMSDVAENEGRTVLYVSHNMATIRKLCTRCVVLNKGKLIYDGDVEKAIEVYLGAVKEELPVFHDFTKTKRAGVDRGSRLFIKSLCFEGRERSIFTTDEKMEFAVEWEALEDIENVRLRFVIARADGNTVGMTCSEPILKGKKGEQHRTRFSFDCRNLVEGVYSFHIMSFVTNEYGGVRDLDKPEKRMYFEIVRGENFLVEWSQRWWGSVRLNPFELLGED